MSLLDQAAVPMPGGVRFQSRRERARGGMDTLINAVGARETPRNRSIRTTRFDPGLADYEPTNFEDAFTFKDDAVLSAGSRKGVSQPADWKSKNMVLAGVTDAPQAQLNPVLGQVNDDGVQQPVQAANWKKMAVQAGGGPAADMFDSGTEAGKTIFSKFGVGTSRFDTTGETRMQNRMQAAGIAPMPNFDMASTTPSRGYPFD